MTSRQARSTTWRTRRARRIASPARSRGIAVDLVRGLAQHGRHGPAFGVHGAEVRERVAVVAPMAGQVALGEALGAARPAGGDADGAVPEARPGQVEARLADRRLLRHHRLDSHRAGIRVGQGRRRPLSALAAEAAAVPADAEEPEAVGGMRGHEGAIDEARSAAESLEAPELPAARHPVRLQAHPRAIRGPDGHGARRRVHAAGLGADGCGVGMSLDQAGE